MSAEWRLLREQTLLGGEAMAYDEAAARTAATGGPRTVRLYQWQPSTLSLGYRQAPESVDWDACERAGIDVIRRNTGGGGIYHDTHGDISSSIIAPADEVPGAIESLVGAFAAHRDEGQTFREWVEDFGVEPIVDLCEPAETDYEDPYMHDAKQSWYPFADGPSPAPTTVDDVPISSD